MFRCYAPLKFVSKDSLQILRNSVALGNIEPLKAKILRGCFARMFSILKDENQ